MRVQFYLILLKIKLNKISVNINESSILFNFIKNKIK